MLFFLKKVILYAFNLLVTLVVFKKAEQQDIKCINK